MSDGEAENPLVLPLSSTMLTLRVRAFRTPPLLQSFQELSILLNEPIHASPPVYVASYTDG